MYITIEDITLYYEVYGNKKQNIVILPGWGDNRLTFDYLIDYLKDHFTIYILDYPGFGNSSLPKKDLTIYDYTNLIDQFINSLQIDNPILFGHSFGGRIIILLTSFLKRKYKKILLIDAAGIKHFSLKLFLKQKIYKLLKKIKYLLPKKYQKKYQKKLFNYFASSDYKQINKTLAKTFQNVIKTDLKKYLSNINHETLIIWGENDNITPLEDGIIMNKKIKNSALIKIEKTGHFPYLEKKYLVSRIIFEYIKKDII